jgi:hypothetical protein
MRFTAGAKRKRLRPESSCFAVQESGNWPHSAATIIIVIFDAPFAATVAIFKDRDLIETLPPFEACAFFGVQRVH